MANVGFYRVFFSSRVCFGSGLGLARFDSALTESFAVFHKVELRSAARERRADELAQLAAESRCDGMRARACSGQRGCREWRGRQFHVRIRPMAGPAPGHREEPAASAGRRPFDRRAATGPAQDKQWPRDSSLVPSHGTPLPYWALIDRRPTAPPRPATCTRSSFAVTSSSSPPTALRRWLFAGLYSVSSAFMDRPRQIG